MKNINYKILAIISCFTILIACNNEECEYLDNSKTCIESCLLFEDFEDETINTPGNWLGINVTSLNVINFSGSQALEALDGSGGSWAYNATEFSGNLIDKGCALQYEVLYEAGSFNGLSTDNSLSIYSGTDPVTFTNRAVFVLYPSAFISSGTLATIEVPLELASGTTLPSNTYGEWILSGATVPYTAANIATFNTLIQNVTGVGFFLDEGSNPSEIWTYDNFCFKQCCPID